MNNVKQIDSNLLSLLEYDISSPTFLIWKRPVRGRKIAGSLTFVKNKPSATLVQINNKSYKVHRIIWAMFNGEISNEKIIDHIDGNPHNNNINNLRLVNIATNNRNKKTGINNKSGHLGVYLETKSGNSYYVATWTINNIQRRKRFKIISDATESLKQAVEFRKLKMQEIQHLGYTDRHLNN